MLYIMLIKIIRLHNINYLLEKKQGVNWDKLDNKS